tara:strand:+ start:758 stop:1000 length:243 start_codon:yes stop_codon:yes gene_type:complete
MGDGMSETEETFRHCPPAMPADGPYPAWEKGIAGEDTVDWEEMRELIADFPVYAITGPLGGSGDCECGKSEMTHGNRFFK